MPGSDYKPLLSKLSPGGKVLWAPNSWYERWIKICQKNAPAKRKALGDREVGIDVHPSDLEGAELSVDVDDIKRKLNSDFITVTALVNGVFTEMDVLVHVEDRR